ncbi:hypothetical protein [Kitasatospora sp. NPDC085879]|uniref:hypothetical protein n=1 Tax=Kitasatospora sp. NPDC085879 TaxID=3154769 RepID=UPI003443ABF1
MMRLSTGKVTAPGAKPVFRGPAFSDTLALREETAQPGAEPLLRRMMADGRRVGAPRTLGSARMAFEADVAALPASARRIADPWPPTATWSDRLVRLTGGTRRRIEAGLHGADAASPGRRLTSVDPGRARAHRHRRADGCRPARARRRGDGTATPSVGP